MNKCFSHRFFIKKEKSEFSFSEQIWPQSLPLHPSLRKICISKERKKERKKENILSQSIVLNKPLLIKELEKGLELFNVFFSQRIFKEYKNSSRCDSEKFHFS